MSREGHRTDTIRSCVPPRFPKDVCTEKLRRRRAWRLLCEVSLRQLSRRYSKMRRSLLFSFPIAALASFWICGSAWSATVPSAPSPEPPPVPRPATARVIELKKLVIRVPARASVGTLRSGWGCLSAKPLTPAAGRAFLTDGDLADVFREEFSAVGYTVPGDPNDLFDEDSDTRPDYLIGGVVRDVKANLCASGPSSG